MQDVEFTVQEGKLFMLQTRTGKRTAKAALKIAVDMVSEGLIDKHTAIGRVDPSALDQLLHPTLDPNAPKEAIAVGLAASPGAATGEVVFTADEAEKLAADGRDVILVRARNQPRRHSRHARGEGHPHRARRHDEPRGGRRARHGAALRLRRGHAEDRRRRGHDGGGRRHHLRAATSSPSTARRGRSFRARCPCASPN